MPSEQAKFSCEWYNIKMYQSAEQLPHFRSDFRWEVKPIQSKVPEGDIHGVLFLDVDGTLTRPGSMYAIDNEPLDVLTKFIHGGGTCIFNTGATLGRLERTVFTRLFFRLDDLTSMEEAKKMFQERVIAAPENGSAVCLSTDVRIVENELNFRWRVIHSMEVPTKQKLREVIQRELVPLFENSVVVGDAPEDENPRQYILSWKGITDTLKQVKMIQEQIIPKHPEVDWARIAMKAARKTIDFVHINSGKKDSTIWMLRELGSLEGPVLGFGDLGDEFAQVVPTVNVNRGKPNEFRRRGMAAMELNHWKLLDKDGYTVLGEGKEAIVRDIKTDNEIQVLRDEKGEIIYARLSEAGYVIPIVHGAGYPVEIQPFFSDAKHTAGSNGDAGKGTAWMLRELMDRGYFSTNRKPSVQVSPKESRPIERGEKQQKGTVQYHVGWDSGEEIQGSHARILEVPIDVDPLEAAHTFLREHEESYIIEFVERTIPGEKYPEF